MFLRSTILLLFVYFQLPVVCQDLDQQFSEHEKESFVEIYWEMKSSNQRNNLELIAFLDSLSISPSRVKEILENIFKGDDSNLNSAELLLIEEVKKENEHIKLQNDLKLENLCGLKNIKVDRYAAMLRRYKTDLPFQRSLMPIFQTVIRKQ